MPCPWIAAAALVVGLVVGVAACQAVGALRRRRGAAPAAERLPRMPPEAEPRPPWKPDRPRRSDALTLLATLQREARFLDFIKEPLAGYSDAQIGAVARDVHRDCALVLDRLFGLVPACTQQEGQEIEVRPGYDPGRFRLTGNVAGQGPFRGRIVHHGWEATRCDLPAWSGQESSARVVAPVEVELK